MKKQIPNMLIIIATAFIMQSHAINLFWDMLGDNATWYEKATAIMMPLTLEAVALSAWYYARFEKSPKILMVVVALLTSSLMAYTAFLKMSKPVSNSISKTEMIENESKLNNSLIDVVGKKVKDTAKYGTHTETKKDTDKFIETIDSQKKIIKQKSKLDPRDKLEAELNVIGLAMLVIIIYQTIAISIISRSLEEEQGDVVPKKGKEQPRPKEEQREEQQQNILEPTQTSIYACNLKKELDDYMGTIGIVVPAHLMAKIARMDEEAKINRGTYTKLKNTCMQKKSDTLGLDKMKEVLSAFEKLKHSN